MTDLPEWFRLINLVLLAVLLIGLAISWWRHRRERIQPLGVAAAAFTVALIYGTAEAMIQDVPAGTRPTLTFAAVVIANVCVYIPLLHRPRKDKK